MDVQHEGVTVAPVAASDNFIRDLDLGLRHTPGHATLTLELGDVACDAGLLATLVDVIGSHLVMRERPGSLLATTHIELHGVDQLHGPGQLVAEARIIASSKRRSVVTVVLRVGAALALAHVGFAVRADPDAPDNSDGLVSANTPMRAPLWETIGIEATDTGARVAVHPYIHNHVGALQGGATATLLERGALQGAVAGTRVSDASINYLAQARSAVIHTVTIADLGHTVSVDCVGEGPTAAFARGTFRLTTPA
jgi:acyl-coenzyme A thioesterase PaaI-like protein